MISIVIASFCIWFCWSHRDDFVDWDGGLFNNLIFINKLGWWINFPYQFVLAQYASNDSECLHVCIELSHCLHPIDDGSDFPLFNNFNTTFMPRILLLVTNYSLVVSMILLFLQTTTIALVVSIITFFYKCFALNKGW